MDNQAALPYPDGSRPVTSSEPLKSHDSDFDEKRRQELERQQRDIRFSQLKQKVELENHHLKDTIDWFKCTKDAKQKVRETNDEIARIRQRLDRFRQAEKISEFCRSLNDKTVDNLIDKSESLISQNLEVIQQLESWRYQYK